MNRVIHLSNQLREEYMNRVIHRSNQLRGQGSWRNMWTEWYIYLLNQLRGLQAEGGIHEQSDTPILPAEVAWPRNEFLANMIHLFYQLRVAYLKKELMMRVIHLLRKCCMSQEWSHEPEWYTFKASWGSDAECLRIGAMMMRVIHLQLIVFLWPQLQLGEEKAPSVYGFTVY